MPNDKVSNLVLLTSPSTQNERPSATDAFLDWSEEAKPTQRKKRSAPPVPSMDVILKARFLPIRYAVLRYPGTTQAALRHIVFKTEYERRNPGAAGLSSLAKCILRPGKRKVLLDCVAYEEYLLNGGQIT